MTDDGSPIDLHREPTGETGSLEAPEKYEDPLCDNFCFLKIAQLDPSLQSHV